MTATLERPPDPAPFQSELLEDLAGVSGRRRFKNTAILAGAVACVLALLLMLSSMVSAPAGQKA